MARVEVVKVRCRKELDDFIRLPYYIYEDCPQYVPDLESDIRNLINPWKNPAYEFSYIQPFVAYRNEVPVGRIVGIINRKANERWQTRNVRFSLIEMIDDADVSAALLDTVACWGRSFGMDAIEGPMGITDFDKEGMLIEDFHLMGTMNTIYNHDYYPRHIYAQGCRKEDAHLGVLWHGPSCGSTGCKHEQGSKDDSCDLKYPLHGALLLYLTSNSIHWPFSGQISLPL